mmetsp:Transcript_8611/g.14308  ORF Transcript_8611/g.14308 Transcript_8611/m.14308 type:complete len:741 (-) Transcript_8611:146-2368(-)|eukprot:CAMPEP_0174961342 /NCGR_PEP_ID=MMETSP0004_2-20121128/4186_1 /TAXON_ID=420556 /ORGANISM="Ochromonas sp., Strain CCMP1393" /LENGTH=740 /DNA_ID=CAMNT_0016209775 /DNA_START=123 /DNA_END=2345 /DNA_ORIENTATION=+
MKFLVTVFIACFLSMVAAECPNACSAHGKCGAYDMCLCYRNWMANDCSERICQFGLAHVDTPKGDLDASSGFLTGPDTTVVQNDFVYPYGTTEQYPATVDADGNVLTNTAHEYRECSNKGICDRQSGTCSCFEGYEGSACQRASCPVNSEGVCSGHGTCESIKEIAARDFNNQYSLWDEDVTMGCVCDGGYTGADCSERICKYGPDPLYYDDEQNIRYSNWTYQFYAKSSGVSLTGNYSLVFYDAYGEDWQTAPIAWNASCEVVTAALEELPNNAVPAGSVKCYKSDKTTDGTSPGQEISGVEPIYNTAMYLFSKYTIAFPENTGKLKQIGINKYLDGTRPTLYTSEVSSTLGWHIYPNGFIGEDVDLVPDRCEDVTVTLNADTTTHYLGGLDVAETKLLKKCLGDSNGDTTDNEDVYDWDKGTKYNPHLIKLIDATQDTSITTTDWNGDTDTDKALARYPITQLCAVSDAKGDQTIDGFPVDVFGFYICTNRNPPGFYAVLYFDDSTYPSNPFRLYTRAAQDYGSTTQFYLYTTKGHLQMVNENSAAFTTTGAYTDAVKIDKYYSNVINTVNSTSTQENFHGNIDCETTAAGSNGALDCLSKDDYVMVLSTNSGTHNAADLAANPVYPNIYQVKKISREDKTRTDRPKTNYGIWDSEQVRNQIVLDYSMNADFVWTGGVGETTDTSAVVYKFYPPSISQRYDYAGECSNRGICNKATGLCDCFPGYSSDNCGMVNALSN